MKTLRYLLIALAVAGCPSAPKLVLPNPPVIDRFTATPATVARGGMVTLEWGTADATQVQIIQVGVGPVAGVENKATGSVSVTVNEQSLFVLNASNSRGVKTTAIATVAVEGAAQQIMFAALPAVVDPGEPTTLVWTAPGARVVTVTPEGGTALDIRGQVETGSVEVSPAVTTRFTLTADGRSQVVDVAVTQAITSFTASTTLADAGQSVTLSWQTTNATKVTLNQPGRGALFSSADGGMANGSVTDVLPPYALGTVVPYQLLVEGAGPTVSETVRVVVGNQPAITSFTGPDYAKLGARFRLSWTTLNADAIELSTGSVTFYRSVTPAEAASGSLELDTPAATTTYTLAALSTAANVRVTATRTQEVVGAATIASFTVTPNTLANGGDPVTISWNVPNARRVHVIDGDGHTVATARGPTAETGTGTAYPNGDTTYTLTADNTVDAPLTADAGVVVTTPASFGAPGTLFANNPFQVSWSIGGPAPLQGFPVPMVDVQAGSTGFVDISDGGTRLPFAAAANDATLSFTPEDFETFMWGTRVAGPYTVSTNGFVVLGPSAATRPTTTAMPNTTLERNFLAAFWANLVFGPDSAVYWQVIGEAPERTLVVQFDHLRAVSEPMADLVFEVKVHQTGVVTYEYKTLANVGSLMPLVGVQGPPGRAVVGPLPSAGSRTTFFGPTTSPLSVTLQAAEPVSGFLKLSNGYLRPEFTPGAFVLDGQVSLTEVMFNPSPAIAATGEWFEVTNNSSVSIDLGGWTVDNVGNASFTIDAGVTVPPGSRVLLGQIERDAGNDDVPVTFAYGPQFAMSDATGTLALANGGYRSQLTWGTGLGGQGVSVVTDTQPHLVVGDTSTTPPHGISCSSRQPFGAQVPQQLGSPGTFAPCLFTMTSIPVSYFDVSGMGTALFASASNRDDSIATVNIGTAPFPYAGAPVSTIVVSTNGWIILRPYTGSSNLTNKTVPSTTQPAGGTLAIFWDDLDTNTSAGIIDDVYSARVAPGTDPNNPGGHWIIQWHHWAHNSSQSDDYNFQIKLFDTGVIEYHYANMISNTSSNYGLGGGATVWLDSPDGGAALVSSVNQQVNRQNTAIRFTP